MGNGLLHPTPPLETELLRLRAFEAGDLGALYVFEHRESLARRIGVTGFVFSNAGC